jgi:hypothetical protein
MSVEAYKQFTLGLYSGSARQDLRYERCELNAAGKVTIKPGSQDGENGYDQQEAFAALAEAMASARF